MSKYIIDLRPDCKVVQQICASNENVNVGARSVGLLDALTDDYIKENFKYLLDAEYQRGFEDGVTKRTDGDACAGCEYKGKTGEHLPCQYCKNAYTNQWRAKKEEIGAGDVVIYNQKKWLVVAPETNARYASLFDSNGNHCSASSQNCQKTGEHYNINEILGGLSSNN